MSEVQKLSHEAQMRAVEALHAAAAATENWTKNVTASVFEGVGSTCRAYGPLERDVANLYESTFVHRKQAVAEANGMVKVFEKRMEKFEKGLEGSVLDVSKAAELADACKDKGGKIDTVNDGVKAACKKIQEMLECEGKCEEARDQAIKARLEVAEEAKKELLAGINARRERIAQDAKDREEKRERSSPFAQCYMLLF